MVFPELYIPPPKHNVPNAPIKRNPEVMARYEIPVSSNQTLVVCNAMVTSAFDNSKDKSVSLGIEVLMFVEGDARFASETLPRKALQQQYHVSTCQLRRYARLTDHTLLHNSSWPLREEQQVPNSNFQLLDKDSQGYTRANEPRLSAFNRLDTTKCADTHFLSVRFNQLEQWPARHSTCSESSPESFEKGSRTLACHSVQWKNHRIQHCRRILYR